MVCKHTCVILSELVCKVHITLKFDGKHSMPKARIWFANLSQLCYLSLAEADHERN